MRISPSVSPRAKSAIPTARSSSMPMTSRCRRPGRRSPADVLAQKYFRKAGVPARLKKVEEERVPSWLWRSVADEAALSELPEKDRLVGEVSCKQVFDRLAGTWTYWGFVGGYFDAESDAHAFFDELRYMLAMQMVAPNSPQWFNTGLHLGLWHRRAEPGPLLCRFPDQGTGEVDHRLRASAAARLLHPVDRRRSRQRGRDHGPVGARGAAVQIRLRHRLEFLQAARRRRKAVRRRQILGPDELFEDRRPRGGRHQVGRHHAPGGEDGDRRRRSSRHRAVHRLEGDRGAEGRQPRHRLEDQPEDTCARSSKPA